MAQYTGFIGIFAIFALAFLCSNNRSAINLRLVICGLSLQLILDMFILRTPWGQGLFSFLGRAVEKLLSFAADGAAFVLGPLANSEMMTSIFGPAGGFIFAFKLVPALIFVASLASFAFHIGIMQRIVSAISWGIYRVVGASGSETTSNAASVFIGQVEAQILIKPYMPTLTQSELLAVMAGSMACISGAIMAVYIQMGVSASYLMAASIMAIPGALVLSKIFYPDTQQSVTRGAIQQTVGRLVKKRLVEKFMDESDRKKVYLELTAKGKAAFEGHEEYHAEESSRIEKLFEGLRPEGVALLKGLLDEVESFMDIYREQKLQRNSQ